MTDASTFVLETARQEPRPTGKLVEGRGSRAEGLTGGGDHDGPFGQDDDVDEGLIAEGFAAQGSTFRGGAVDNLGGAPMGKGHDNSNQAFDLNTACYLKPVYRKFDEARRNGRRMKIVVKAGVKTVKSFTLEVCAADHACNGNGDTAIYFGSETAAESTATTRILDFYRSIPNFRKKMDTMRSRFDETMGAMKFPDKTLFILSANLGNTQQKNLGFAGLQDAFVTGKTGMIKEMIARTTQYSDAIVFLESQGGEKDFDFDKEYDDTDQGELHVRCPFCGVSHVFNWKAWDEREMQRPEVFRARLPARKVWEIVRRYGAFDLVRRYKEAVEYLNIKAEGGKLESGNVLQKETKQTKS